MSDKEEDKDSPNDNADDNQRTSRESTKSEGDRRSSSGRSDGGPVETGGGGENKESVGNNDDAADGETKQSVDLEAKSPVEGGDAPAALAATAQNIEENAGGQKNKEDNIVSDMAGAVANDGIEGNEQNTGGEEKQADDAGEFAAVYLGVLTPSILDPSFR